MDEDPKDPRSTGRKRARAVLLKLVEEGEREFACECEEINHNWHEGKCGWVPDTSKPLGRNNQLDVDHRSKNILDNDPVNLRFMCRRCHRAEDRKTSKGVSSIQDDMYNFDGYT